MMGLFELEESNEPEGNNLLVVDLLNVCFRYQRRNNYDFAADLMRTLNSLAKSYGCTKILLLSDHKYSKYRRQLYPEYKQNRKARYEKQTDEERNQMGMFFQAYDEALEIIGERFDIIRLEHVEADDVAGFVCANFSQDFDHTWLISSDSDWDLLLAENVSRFSLVTRKEYHLSNFYEEHKCDDPDQYLCLKVLAGDAKDGISGIPDIGPGRAYKLIREYGTAIDLLSCLPLEGKLKTIQNLNEFGHERIIRNYQLLDLKSYHEDAILAAGHTVEGVREEICQALIS